MNDMNDGNGLATIIVIGVAALLVILLIVRNIRVVPQARAFVIERLGAYNGTWQVGLHFKIPIIDRIANRVSLKENVLDFPPQPVITKDNVTIEIDTVIYFQVTDPKLYTYGVEYPMAAIENLTATTLRNIIGDLELDESLTSREHINARMREVLDEATDAWGVKINRVEVKNITPPRDIQVAMEKQMRAERERREAILRAEGEKRSAILIAEGNKEARILDAEAKKRSKILEAEATKEMQVLEATGEADAILLVQKATADGIKMIVESNPTDPVLTLKGLEAFEKAADGRATKIIIPSNIQGLAGLATSLAEIVTPVGSEGLGGKTAGAVNNAPKAADATIDVKA
ncbi:MAG: SPFH/Band 7/PHB domain protein [Clostridiales Family XIII bacterium]|jgi:regulator of protease activity HflC (stomatin/prohibitin superfamily)|nr:SPFH/Band 7/PHB domain protein [Clostridiales Family XIII bacterium]